MAQQDYDSLARMLFGVSRLEEQVNSTGGSQNTRTYYGVASADSSNGYVEVVLTDNIVLPEDADGNEIGSTSIKLPTIGNIKQGDSVKIMTTGSGAAKAMSVVGSFGSGDRMARDITDASDTADAAAQAAAEAYAAVETQEEHFWADSNGVHVATTAGDADSGPNLLANSLGVLLRIADKIKTAMTSSGFAIYDGLGNAASNIVALFGSSITLGQTGAPQVTLDSTGLNMTNFLGNNTLSVGLKSASSNVSYFYFGDAPSGVTYGDFSFAAGQECVAGDTSVAMGGYSTATSGVALGLRCTAKNRGIALGDGVIANGNQLAIGYYNAEDTSGQYSLIYGQGQPSARANGYAIDKTGHIVDPSGGTTLKQYTLFSSSGGTLATSGGTLTQSISGFSWIEVFYHTTIFRTVYGSTKVAVSGTTTNEINLTTNFSANNGSIYYSNFVYCPISITSSRFSVPSSTAYGHAYIGSDGAQSVDNTCYVRIDKIIGYK